MQSNFWSVLTYTKNSRNETVNQGKIILFCLKHYCFSPFWKILYHIFFIDYISAAYTTVWCPSVVVLLGSVFKNKYLTVKRLVVRSCLSISF